MYSYLPKKNEDTAYFYEDGTKDKRDMKRLHIIL